MWSANSDLPFADLILNNLQFVYSYLPTRWQRVDTPQRYAIFSAELAAIFAHGIQVVYMVAGWGVVGLYIRIRFCGTENILCYFGFFYLTISFYIV